MDRKQRQKMKLRHLGIIIVFSTIIIIIMEVKSVANDEDVSDAVLKISH